MTTWFVFLGVFFATFNTITLMDIRASLRRIERKDR